MAMKVVIEGTNITASQMSEFWKLAANPDSHVNRGTFQAYLEGRNPFEEKSEKPLAKAVATALLALVTTVTLPAVTEPLDPQVEFKKPHIHLWNDFEQRVLPALKPVASAPEAKIAVSRFTRAANDTGIRGKLPEYHLGEWHDITSFIDRQKNGEDGVLLTNGWANIFYLIGVNDEVFAVSVRWSSVNRQWFVRAWHLDGHGRWDGDDQVLSRDSQVLAD